jgi:hypothetical protein
MADIPNLQKTAAAPLGNFRYDSRTRNQRETCDTPWCQCLVAPIAQTHIPPITKAKNSLRPRVWIGRWSASEY